LTVLLDSNVYIYALDPSDAGKHQRALEIVRWHLAEHAVVARQVIGEVFAVSHRKRATSVADVRLWAEELVRTCLVLPTDDRHLGDASLLAERHKLQFWDAVICTVARRAGATLLMSEDFHDGVRFGTLSVINPFIPSNQELVDEIIG
jgi:predicted nucleic acid-binding protein